MALDAQERERQILEYVAPRYERDGFLFVRHPTAEYLPTFFEGYRPDAVALKTDRKIAVEIISPSPGAQRRLDHVRRLFENRDDWKLDVVTPPRPQEDVSPASIEEIQALLTSVDHKALADHPIVALLMLWSALEAAARRLDRSRVAAPQRPTDLVEWLAQEGHVLPNEAAVLRGMARLHNHAAHGGLGVAVGVDDLSALRSLVAALLEISPDPAAR
jgi:hypothetical protein